MVQVLNEKVQKLSSFNMCFWSIHRKWMVHCWYWKRKEKFPMTENNKLIFETFIGDDDSAIPDDLDFESEVGAHVNIDWPVREKITETLRKNPTSKNIYDQAQTAILHSLLDEAWPRFKESDILTQYQTQVKSVNNSIYSPTAVVADEDTSRTTRKKSGSRFGRLFGKKKWTTESFCVDVLNSNCLTEKLRDATKLYLFEFFVFFSKWNAVEVTLWMPEEQVFYEVLNNFRGCEKWHRKFTWERRNFNIYLCQVNVGPKCKFTCKTRWRHLEISTFLGHSCQKQYSKIACDHFLLSSICVIFDYFPWFFTQSYEQSLQIFFQQCWSPKLFPLRELHVKILQFLFNKFVETGWNSRFSNSIDKKSTCLEYKDWTALSNFRTWKFLKSIHKSWVSDPWLTTRRPATTGIFSPSNFAEDTFWRIEAFFSETLINFLI